MIRFTDKPEFEDSFQQLANLKRRCFRGPRAESKPPLTSLKTKMRFMLVIEDYFTLSSITANHDNMLTTKKAMKRTPATARISGIKLFCLDLLSLCFGVD